jgi:hypothetical protein
MKTVRLFGFENIPEGYQTNTALSIHGLTYSDFQPLQIGTTTGQPLTPRIVNNKIVLGKAALVPTGIEGAVIWPMSTFIGGTTPIKVIIGMRIERPIASGVINTVDWRSTTNPATAVLGALLTAAQVPVASTGYYEFVLDTVARTVTVFKDDVQLSTGAMLASMTQANLASIYLSMGRCGTNWNSTGNGVVTDCFIVSDVYSVTDDGIGGSSNIERLGPISVKRLPVISAVGAGYTPSDGSSVPSVLNVGREGTSSLNTPNALTPMDGTPLRLKFDASQIGVLDIAAVDAKIAPMKTSDSTDPNFSAKFSYAGNDSASRSATFAATAPPVNLAAGTLLTFPGGDKLRASSLSNLELVLTPTS